MDSTQQKLYSVEDGGPRDIPTNQSESRLGEYRGASCSIQVEPFARTAWLGVTSDALSFFEARINHTFKCRRYEEPSFSVYKIKVHYGLLFHGYKNIYFQ